MDAADRVARDERILSDEAWALALEAMGGDFATWRHATHEAKEKHAAINADRTALRECVARLEGLLREVAEIEGRNLCGYTFDKIAEALQ